MEIFRESNKYSCFYDLFKKHGMKMKKTIGNSSENVQ
jgi:hypothetical protein